ncbi:ABC transporter ATP-binding protein [Dongia soli]|uniref:ABC transporter ATP-binding protein n=1 Tax=Dongia soli TaxID=600628 RepID=A0ABU5EEU8_9PROT|nr:ABC transporter ATP-binding protein [Dongia soli]MDY0884379.1 ABC transporter ATP-binding protein [Dongia soli]
MNSPLLDVKNLQKRFDIRRGLIPRAVGHVHAVQDVSFSLRSHEVLGIVGESGSGKTTIGRSVLRLTEPSDGEIIFNGKDVTKFSGSELRQYRRSAQIIFQDPYAALNPTMTIEEILSEPLIVQNLIKDRQKRKERVAELLDMVGLSAEYMTRLPNELSGGQRQRVVIARALAVEPQFVVADEPVSALDVSVQAQIIALLKDLKQRLGLSMIFISHNLAVVEYLADRIAVVYLGRIMEIGTAAEVCNAPKHPYTIALLSAVLDPGTSTRRQRVILQGDLPDPANPPSGCVFRTRCPYAIADCAIGVPEMRSVSSTHARACIRDDVG